MDAYFLIVLLTVLFIGSFFLIEKKAPSSLKPLPIVTHLLCCVTILPLTLFIWKYNTGSIPVLAQAPILSLTNSYVSSFMLAFILIDISIFKPHMRMAKLGISSLILPFLGGIGLAAYFNFLIDIPKTIAISSAMAISAVPVLYLYLKQMNKGYDTTSLLLGSAIFVDIVVWVIAGFAISQFKLSYLLAAIILGFLPLLVHKIYSKYGSSEHELIWKNILFILFFIIFSTLLTMNGYALLFAVIFFYNTRKVRIEFSNFLPEKWLHNFFNYFAIPFLFVCAAFQINWNLISQNFNWIEFSAFALIPIVFKIIGSWIGLKLVKFQGNKIEASFLLNSRGLTEIIFLNMLFMFALLSPTQYLGLITMSFISTIIPGIMYKFSNRNQLPKHMRLTKEEKIKLRIVK